MKKYICIILMLCITITTMATTDFMVDGLNYTILSDSEVEVNGFSSSSVGYPWYSAEQLDIPSTVKYNNTSYDVVSIGANAFSSINGNIYLGDFTKVTLPTTIREIKEDAFLLKKITAIELNEGLMTIGNRAFGLTEITRIDFPSTLKSIGDWSFDRTKLIAIETHNVEIIGRNAFQYTPIETLTIGNGLRDIGEYAFFHCQNLTELKIPCNVLHVGEFAFGACTNVTKLTIEDGAQPLSIHNSSFRLLENILSMGDTSPEHSGIGYEDDSSLKSLYIGRQYDDANKYEKDRFFSFYSQLTSLTLGGYLKEILPYSFGYLPKLQSITLPKQINKVSADGVFYGCPELSNLIIEAHDNNPLTFTGIPLWHIKSATISRQVEGDGDIFGDRNTIESVVFNGGFKEINNVTALYSCPNLRDVVFDCPLSSICDGAFHHCQSLTSVIIPNSVTSIGALAFKGCTSLLSAVISDNVSVIPEQTFMDCTNLSSIHIGEKVSTIENFSFSDCSSLSEIEFSDALQTIKPFAFQNCTALKTVTLGNNVKVIDGFQGCTNLHEFRIPTIEAWLKIQTCNTEEYPYSLIVDGKEYENLEVPDNIKEIYPYAFRGCTSLKSAKLNNITTLGVCAFDDCINLRSIDTGNNIVGFSLSGCISLKSLTLGRNISGLGDISCCDLDKVTCLAEFPPSAGGATFSNTTYDNAILTIPYGTTEKYTTARCWERFKNIQEESASEIPVESISLNEQNISLCTGYQYQLLATIIPSDASNCEVVWQTSNPDVAMVSNNGLVIAIGEGTCEIHVTSKDNPSATATCIVSVYHEKVFVEKIVLSQISIKGEEGATCDLSATVLPEDADDKSIEWTSHNPIIASVNEYGNVEFHSVGQTSIVAKALDGSMVTAECQVTVTEKAGIGDITADDTQHVRIYTLTGTLIYEGEYSKFNHESGIYIMQTDNYATQRLIL